MDHRASAADLEFRRAFEACEVAPQDFDHAAHVRLAYIHLCDQPVEVAAERMKRSLLAFLDHLGASRSKYHETITQAWIRAVSHFMSKPQRHLSAASFTAANPQLLTAASC